MDLSEVMEFLETEIPFVGFSILQLIWAVIIAVVGVVIVKVVARMVGGFFEKIGAPPLISGLMKSIVRTLGYIVVVITALSTLGINTTAVGLGLSAIVGLVLGFGLQDTLTNMAAGIWLAIIRPFDKGDVVSIAGYTGKIEGIGIMSTQILTFDNVFITIPNKNVWGSPIVNYTRMPIRRVDLNVGVAYGTDLDRAVRIALEVLRKHPLVLDEPEPAVAITDMKESYINLQVRAWCRKEDYGRVKHELIRDIHNAFNREGIEIPYPKLDVYIKSMPGGEA